VSDRYRSYEGRRGAIYIVFGFRYALGKVYRSLATGQLVTIYGNICLGIITRYPDMHIDIFVRNFYRITSYVIKNVWVFLKIPTQHFIENGK